VITLDLRRAIARAAAGAGFGPAADPGLRPGGEPGQYSSSVAFGLAETETPGRIAARLAAALEDQEPWIAQAGATGPGYVTVTVTAEALGNVADRIVAAGPGCVRSDALAGRTFPKPGSADPLAAATWEAAATWAEARRLLAAELTARLAEAAGAAIAEPPAAIAEPGPEPPATRAEPGPSAEDGGEGGIGRDGTIRSGERQPAPAVTVAFAGRDAVLFSLARALPESQLSLDQRKIARHHVDNPAYAVRYAHARAASGVRWAAAADPDQAGPQRPSADPGELALLDALSWLPERVATAARRGRPDEFARYIEHAADATLAALTRPRERSAAAPPPRRAPGSERLALARAARTGLAAGLELLGVSAPDRL
jgi:arginyl-tRNA synthetase